LLTAAHVLTALGFAAMVSRPDPLRDSVLFVRYAQGVAAASASPGSFPSSTFEPAAFARSVTCRSSSPSCCRCCCCHRSEAGRQGAAPRSISGHSSRIEAIRILLALFLAGYFARNWELLRAVRSERLGTLPLPSWVNLPRARGTRCRCSSVSLPHSGLFFGQRDLGPALMLAVVFLGAYAVARGTVGMVIAGAVCLAAGFYLGYRLDISATLVDRVRIWQAPWDNIAHGGDQVAQALWSLSTAPSSVLASAWVITRYLPAGHTDLVLAAIGEELGYLGLLLVALLYATIVGRALAIARRASTDYGFFLAILLALFIAVPVLLMGERHARPGSAYPAS
jgi:hypothetical protein